MKIPLKPAYETENKFRKPPWTYTTFWQIFSASIHRDSEEKGA
jgi:hypothetical protein